jgi:hypothetical protein
MLDELDRFEAYINRWVQSKFYEARSDVDDLFALLRPKEAPLILAVSASNFEDRQEVAYRFSKYATSIVPLKNANYVIVRTDVDGKNLPGVVGSWRARPVREPGLIGDVPFNRRMKRCNAPSSASHLGQIGVPQAHKVTRGAGIKVAIIDTGVDGSHSELEGRVVGGYDFVNKHEGCNDDNGHGTHVAGLIAGESVGAAPAASLYAAKVLDARGSGNEANVAQGIDWAIENKVNLINMSLGSGYPSPLERELLKAATAKGIVVFAAAGNEGRGKSYPAAYPGVISVAAVDRNNEHAPFSNIDETVDISAPGVDIVSCVPGGYAKHSGTSMASPLAAGVGALVASTDCSAIEDALESSAQELGDKEMYGAGLVRADLAVVHNTYKSNPGRRSTCRT